MTREEAIDIVYDLISAVRDYDRADYTNVRYYRAEYEVQVEILVSALSSAQVKSNDA